MGIEDAISRMGGTMTTLWHGSRTGITGNIVSTKSRSKCDFGVGFYTGDDRRQAESLVVDCDAPTLYELSIDLSGFNVYRFTDMIEWALYVGYNRRCLGNINYNVLYDSISKIDGHDCIVGPIADDMMYYAYGQFVHGAATTAGLIEALKYVKLGNQYVFKNDMVCSQIRMVSETRLHSSNIVTKGRMSETVRDAIDNVIRDNIRNGVFIHELLKGL